MAECEWDGCDFGGLYSAPHLRPRKFCLIHREEMMRIFLREKNAKAQRNAARATRESMYEEEK